jgi:tRNA nucleotidyltransferase (CCA-adding enzyme)
VDTPQQRIGALGALRCGAVLLELAAGRDDVWLVGGAVRDLLLGREPAELDLVASGDATEVATLLGEVTSRHERFGTAMARRGDCMFDVARMRSETYPSPGALPEVAAGTLDQDLRRRDFTINAIAMTLEGELIGVEDALDDLRSKRLRVLHDRSFLDDPTRLWRLVRYAVRLGFAIEPHTARLAADAVSGGALRTVSGDRLGAELRLALREPDPLGTLHAASNLGLIAGLTFDPDRTGQALELLPADGRADLLVLGSCLTEAATVEGMGFTAAELAVLRRCAAIAPLEDDRASAVAARVRDEPVEAVALAGAAGSRRMAEMWLLRWRGVTLEIDGEDLIAAGIPEGPEVGRRLQRALDRKLDGEVSGREAELAAALD